MGHWLLILKFAIRMFSKINMKLIRSQNKLRQIAMKPGQKSPVSHLLETSSQITWKISLEVNIINHISYPFLKSMFIEKWSNSTYCWRQQEGLLLILNLWFWITLFAWTGQEALSSEFSWVNLSEYVLKLSSLSALQPFLVEGQCGDPSQMHLLWLSFLRGSTPFCHWKGRSGLSRQPGQYG